MAIRPVLGAATLLLLALALESPAQGPVDPILTVRVVGDGKVTSDPAGIDCQPDCSNAFPRGPRGVPRVVRLTAVPGAGQELEAWGESCTGQGGCSVVMDGNRVVTARFHAVAEPPPPPPAGSAYLTVEAGAGGTVSGPGIACGEDCAEALALGTVASLSAVPDPGYSFAGWLGACTGGGGCSPAVNGPTLVFASFEPVAPRRPPLRGPFDADGDRVADENDQCLDTLPGVKVKRNGCAPLDAVFHGEELLEPLSDSVSDALDGLGGVPGAKPIGPRMRRALRLVDKGAFMASKGNVCGGAGVVRKGVLPLRSTVKRATRLLSSEQQDVLEEASAPGVGDADDSQFKWAALNGASDLAQEAAGEGTRVLRAYKGACDALGGRVRGLGRVLNFDDASGLLRLASGKRFLVPHSRFAELADQSLVRVIGKKAPGPDLAGSVEAVDPSDQVLKLAPCMQLRIAPFQDFIGPAAIKHHPNGYRKDGTLWLEAGARLAASPKCSHGAQGRYSLAIEFRQGSTTISAASDLDANDPPVPLPVGPNPSLWTIVVTERRQGSNCPPPGDTPQGGAAISFPCPVVELSKTEYKARIRPTGSYATAVYSTTEFGLEIDAPAPVVVTGLTGQHTSLPGTASFEGEGFKPTGHQATGPIVTVNQNETWALWPKIFYGWDDGLLFPMDTAGVDHYAGLFWPRVVGSRSGRPYRYAAELPDLVTDRLGFCEGENCFYMPPWPFEVSYNTGQGNGPGFSHNGNQLFAFDFSVPDGGELVAARGGVVGDVVENLTQNYNPCDPATPDADGLGNYVRIDHQDGTYGYYVHLKTNTVPLLEGDEISRGTPLGQADNTGRSCGPHLHFQSQIVTGPQYYGQTLRIRFETWVEGQQSPYTQLCYIPVAGDVLISPNG